jgi:hypothetical protein
MLVGAEMANFQAVPIELGYSSDRMFGVADVLCE